MVAENAEDNVSSDYDNLMEYVSEKRHEIVKNKRILKNIMIRLNKRIPRTEKLEEFRQDAHIMLSAVKMQQDVFAREYCQDMTVEWVVEAGNRDELANFFAYVESKNYSVEFPEQLYLAHRPKERRAASERKRYDTPSGPLRKAESVEVDEVTPSEERCQYIKEKLEVCSPVEYFRFILDPHSYSKTIQNAYDLALAIRTKGAALKYSNGQFFVVRWDSGSENVGYKALELSPSEHKALVSELGITEAFLK